MVHRGLFLRFFLSDQGLTSKYEVNVFSYIFWRSFPPIGAFDEGWDAI